MEAATEVCVNLVEDDFHLLTSPVNHILMLDPDHFVPASRTYTASSPTPTSSNNAHATVEETAMSLSREEMSSSREQDVKKEKVNESPSSCSTAAETATTATSSSVFPPEPPPDFTMGDHVYRWQSFLGIPGVYQHHALVLRVAWRRPTTSISRRPLAQQTQQKRASLEDGDDGDDDDACDENPRLPEKQWMLYLADYGPPEETAGSLDQAAVGEAASNIPDEILGGEPQLFDPGNQVGPLSENIHDSEFLGQQSLERPSALPSLEEFPPTSSTSSSISLAQSNNPSIDLGANDETGENQHDQAATGWRGESFGRERVSIPKDVSDRQKRRGGRLRTHWRPCSEGWTKVRYGCDSFWQRSVARSGTVTTAPSDPPALVRMRLQFLLDLSAQDNSNNHGILPSYDAVQANGECVCTWCKTGTWATVQATSWLAMTAAGQVKSAATLVGMAAATQVTVPASGLWGWLGYTTQVSLLSTQPWLIPALATYGVVTVGVPTIWLWRAQQAWKETTRQLNQAFWDQAVQQPDLFAERMTRWSEETGHGMS